MMQPSPVAAERAEFAADVRAGLSLRGQKSLSPKYFYDALGSLLFEAITQLPEYGLWRAEHALLTAHAEDIAVATDANLVVELGSGSANKSLLVLRALLRRQAIAYLPIDVSAAALEMTRRELAGTRGLNVRTIEADYQRGLELALQGRPDNARALVMFLGSSIGNFDDLGSQRLLQRVRRSLKAGDYLLLGADLRQSEARMLAAYDDAIGVTAAFNRNVLSRINRELNADFDLAAFEHRARYNAQAHAVEMHLVARVAQQVHIGAAELRVAFAAGETIHTESSHKYSLAELDGLAQISGFAASARWQGADWPFVSALYRAV